MSSSSSLVKAMPQAVVTPVPPSSEQPNADAKLRGVVDRSMVQALPQGHQSARFVVPVPQPTPTAPFSGSCKDCADLIRATVRNTIAQMDFDGLKPYMKIIAHMESGHQPAEEWVVDSSNEEPASTCVGMSLALLKKISENHHVEGLLAAERDPEGQFRHAAVIIECEDGLVFVDNRANPDVNVRPVKFGFSDRGITAALRGSVPPLSLENGNQRFEYYTHVANGADLVMKHFMAWAIGEKFIPIQAYREDGNPLKDILVSSTRQSILLRDHHTGKASIPVTFEALRRGEFTVEDLKDWMDSDFKSSPEVLHDELVRFAVHEPAIVKIVKLFAKCYPR